MRPDGCDAATLWDIAMAAENVAEFIHGFDREAFRAASGVTTRRRV